MDLLKGRTGYLAGPKSDQNRPLTQRKEAGMFFIYIGYSLIGLLVYVLIMTGRLKVRGTNNIPLPGHDKRKPSILFVVNHPSLREPLVMVGVLFLKYFPYPASWSIWSTPDRDNFYAHRFWGLFRKRFIPVPRERGKKNHRLLFGCLLKIVRVLRQPGQSVILFPEGGRTCVAKKLACSEPGKRLGVLKSGVGAVIRKSGDILVIPVRIGCPEDKPTDDVSFWTTFGRLFWPMTVTIGEGFLADATYRAHSRDWITADVEKRMRKIGDMARYRLAA